MYDGLVIIVIIIFIVLIIILIVWVSNSSAPTTTIVKKCDKSITYSKLFGACGESLLCGPGLTCALGQSGLAGTCRKEDGQRCELGIECLPGSVCLGASQVSTGYCTATVPGELNSAEQCNTGFTKNDLGLCKIMTGYKGCAIDDDCIGSNYCFAGHCLNPKKLGQSCFDSCGPGLQCSNNYCQNIGYTTGEWGAYCSSSVPCQNNLYCNNGSCDNITTRVNFLDSCIESDSPVTNLVCQNGLYVFPPVTVKLTKNMIYSWFNNEWQLYVNLPQNIINPELNSFIKIININDKIYGLNGEGLFELANQSTSSWIMLLPREEEFYKNNILIKQEILDLATDGTNLYLLQFIKIGEDTGRWVILNFSNKIYQEIEIDNTYLINATSLDINNNGDMLIVSADKIYVKKARQSRFRKILTADNISQAKFYNGTDIAYLSHNKLLFTGAMKDYSFKSVSQMSGSLNNFWLIAEGKIYLLHDDRKILIPGNSSNSSNLLAVSNNNVYLQT